MLNLSLTPGQASDIGQAQAVLAQRPCQILVADKGYDANAFLDLLEQRGVEAVIPSRRDRFEQRPHNKILYRLRNRVERFFNRLKHFRRVATRYEKLARHYQGMVLLAAILLHIRL